MRPRESLELSVKEMSAAVPETDRRAREAPLWLAQLNELSRKHAGAKPVTHTYKLNGIRTAALHIPSV